MLYFDTSFLTPLFVGEATSSQVNRFITHVPAGELSTSHWARVEFSSMLGRQVRTNYMERSAALVAEEQLDLFLRRSFTVFLPIAEDFDLTKTYLRRHETGLRGGDALHLAIAANRSVAAMHTLDKTMLKAGAALGLPISAGIR
jgi:predicted nucleic acid-binding protein